MEENPAPCQILHLLEEGGPRPLTFVLNANLLVNVKIVACKLKILYINIFCLRWRPIFAKRNAYWCDSWVCIYFRWQSPMLVLWLNWAAGSGTERVSVFVGVLARRKDTTTRSFYSLSQHLSRCPERSISHFMYLLKEIQKLKIYA